MPSVSFDGPNRIITVEPATTELVVKTMYSEWKEWTLDLDNAKYPFAFTVVGGNPTVGGNSITPYFFLSNGWKVRPDEKDQVLIVDGILITDDQSNPFTSTIGNFQVSIQSIVPIRTETVLVNTGGSGLTFNDLVVANQI